MDGADYKSYKYHPPVMRRHPFARQLARETAYSYGPSQIVKIQDLTLIGIRKDLNLQKQFDNRIVMKIEKSGFLTSLYNTGK